MYTWVGIAHTIIASLLFLVLLAQPSSKTGEATFATPVLHNVLGRRSSNSLLIRATIILFSLFLAGCLFINKVHKQETSNLINLSEELTNLDLTSIEE